MKRISLEEFVFGDNFISVTIPYDEFVSKYGERHYEHPKDWDAPGPVELWCFELPWGHKIILEYYLGHGGVSIILGKWEFDSIIDYLELNSYEYEVHDSQLKKYEEKWPEYKEGIGKYALYRQDDNSNVAIVKVYESARVAEYYRKTYEDKGHKQFYWIEQESA